MRLRFTIRDLLWLTVVVALAEGWWLDRAKLAADLTANHQEMQIERKEMINYIDFQRQHGGDNAEALLKKIQEFRARAQ